MKIRQVAPSPKDLATCQSHQGVFQLARSTYKNIYQYKKETQKPPSKRYNPWKHVNKIENRAHNNNFKTIYESLIPISVKQQQQADATLGVQTTDYTELYGIKQIPLTDGRTITLRYVKIPTISQENKPQYYVMFFLNIEYFSIQDFKSLHALCLNSIDQKTIEGYLSNGNRGRYTIYLSGKQTGRTKYLQWNQARTKYHIWKINTITAKGNTRSYAEVRKSIFVTIEKLFSKKIDRIIECIRDGWHWYRNQKMNHDLYGHIKEDVERLKSFLGQIRKTARYFWKIKKRLDAARKRERLEKKAAELNDVSSKCSNNIRKQTEQYLKLVNSVKKSCETAEKTRDDRDRHKKVVSWV